jgi:hypothetical protein
MMAVESVVAIEPVMVVETRVTDALVHAAPAYVTAPEALTARSSRLARRIDGKHNRQCGERQK